MSYAEIIIAMAIFCIAMLPVLPALSMAGHNASRSAEAYKARLAAEGIMFAAREAAASGREPAAYVGAYVSSLDAAPFAWGFWVFDEKGALLTHGADGFEAGYASASSDLFSIAGSTFGFVVVAAAVIGEGGPAGHSAGFANAPR